MSWKVIIGTLIGMSISASAASANDPIGACCAANGTCAEIMVTPCEFDGGSFIGEGTTCAEIDCAARLTVPMVSIAGLVSIFGALGSLGIYALVRRRRGPS